MKLTVDEGRCSGHGRCYAMAPALLEPDDDGHVTIRGSAIDVPVEHEAAAREAVGWCPEGAIELHD